MKYISRLIFLLFIVSAFTIHGNAQHLISDPPKGTATLVPDTVLLRQHIITLADDAMEGRETGTEGEKKAYMYLSKEFRAVGLIPKGTNGYIQPFPFNAGSYMGKENEFVVEKKRFNAGADFFPLGYSANKEFRGMTVTVGYGIAAPGRNDYTGLNELNGKIFIMEYGFPEGMDPHSRLAEHADIRTRIDTAASKGA